MAVPSFRSDVWDHFRKVDKRAICCHCNKELAYCGGTTNLRDHLNRMHPSKYSPDSTTPAEKKAAPKIESFVKRTVCSEGHAKKITNLMVEMVTLDLRPAAMVEGIGFKRLINYLEPNYRVPSAVHITSCLQEHYAKAKTMVIRMLEEPMHIALTTDIWTSVATRSYITVTAHFVSSSWELKTCLLQTTNFPENHTADHICEKLQEILSNFNVSCSKVVAIVHDQGSNMQCCGRRMKSEFGWESMNCAAHLIQLCVEDGLKLNTIDRLLGACRKLVGHFKHSTVATAALVDRQKRMNMPVKRLLQDVATRWNSIYYLLDRLVEMRWPISAVLSDERVTKRLDRNLDLRSDQWDLAKELLAPLQQIEVATVYFSEESKVSISSVLPILYGIMDNLAVADEDSSIVKNFKQTVVSSIKRRWSLHDISPILGLTTVLDARFKLLKFLPDTQKSDIVDALKSNVERLLDDSDPDCTMVSDTEPDCMISDHSPSTESEAPSVPTDSQISCDGDIPARKKPKKSALDILLGPEETSGSFTIDDEIDMYLQLKPPARSTKIFEWWKVNEPRFPNVSKLAKSILCIPATSTASERIFSSAGTTISKKRNCLKPENVDKILFLNKNFCILNE